MFRKLGKLAILTVGCAIAHGAAAMPVVVDFTVTATFGFDGDRNFSASSYHGYNSGTVGGGSFAFDDSIGAFRDENVGRAVADLQFDWLGESWNETSAVLYSLNFDSTGALSSWALAAAPQPDDHGLVWISSPGPTDFWIEAFSPTSGQGSLAGLHSAGTLGWMYGSVDWSVRPTSVPEPGSLAMMAAGLLGLRFSKRKRKL